MTSPLVQLRTSRMQSGEDALVTRLLGKGSRKGSTLPGRAGDVIQHPPVWASFAGILAMTGPGGRRAALRGAVGYAAATLLHLPLKGVTGRSRPRGAGLFHLGPVTSSFPSGHAGSDLAFVLAAAQEAPLLALPLTAATMVVHWSLVRSRSHYPSDVFFGGVLGIAVVVAMARVWPPVRGRSGSTSVSLSPNH
ncbi:MAG TPA: phosphatase PAP2 family protein [Egibacteraceae bacterium]|nr:phosphatase PAP2 family protein [Egibacteraceae bacterium]